MAPPLNGRVERPDSGRPQAKNASVSAQMSRMPREGTSPEVSVRRALHRAGLRFTVHRRDLPGTPDIVLSRARIAVFIDGCFWHGCPDHGTLPKNNRNWWRAKLEGNQSRDRRKDAALREAGWVPLHFWEHEPVGAVVEAVTAIWRQRTGRH